MNTETGGYKCHRCGTKGYVTPWLAKKWDVPFVRWSSESSSYEVEDLPKGYIPLFPSRVIVRSVVMGRYVRRILKNRPCTYDDIDRVRLGVVGDKSDKQWLVGSWVFPSRDSLHPGYTLRLPSGEYRTMGPKRGEGALIGGDVLGTEKDLWVVEGNTDVLCMGDSVVGLYGKDITDPQLDRIIRHPGEVIVAIDGDSWRECEIIAYRMALHRRGVFWVKFPPGKDPGELGFSFAVQCERYEV